MLTCRGRTFAGRVAASLLSKVGLPEMITSSPAEYEALALALAADPDRLTVIRKRLVENRERAFDNERFVRNLEAVYEEIWKTHCLGQARK